jgi:hypothetical protein
VRLDSRTDEINEGEREEEHWSSVLTGRKRGTKK